jgi:hypothetical protein
VESYGADPVIVYVPERPTGEARSLGSLPEAERHGNFFDAAYAVILARPEWNKRFSKVHAQGRSLPRNVKEPGRKWRELDSCMSSDALLMNVFCAPGVAESVAVRGVLGIDADDPPIFGLKAKVPLKSGLFDRTEVDMRWGNLLVEAKLTESDFQTRSAAIVEGYRDFEAVFDPELLPRVAIRLTRRKQAMEFPEEFSQEWEPEHDDDAAARSISAEFQAGIEARADEIAPKERGFVGYQLIRNVLAAHAQGASFCVIHDERRPDLREAWFQVMAAVKAAELRTRLKVLTWQELAQWLPQELQRFLQRKYGIVRADKTEPPA